MTSQSNSNWSSWAVNTLVKNPLSWSVGRIKESILPPTPAIDEKSEYVILHLIEVIHFINKPLINNILLLLNTIFLFFRIKLMSYLTLFL